jgi:membrane protease YdiL (CAAX protease family)
MMKDLIASGLGSFVALVLVAPFTEEGIFRGLMLNGFLKRYSPRKAVVLSAVLFSLIHVNPYQMLSAFFMGLMFAWLRIRTKSLWPCIYLHIVHNLIVFSVGSLPFIIQGFTPDTLGDHYFQPWWFDGIGLVLVIAGFLSIHRSFPKYYNQ